MRWTGAGRPDVSAAGAMARRSWPVVSAGPLAAPSTLVDGTVDGGRPRPSVDASSTSLSPGAEGSAAGVGALDAASGSGSPPVCAVSLMMDCAAITGSSRTGRAGDGAWVIGGTKTTLFCAWLAWCRFAGGARDLGQDRAECVRRAGCHAAPPGWGTDLCADRKCSAEHFRSSVAGSVMWPRVDHAGRGGG